MSEVKVKKDEFQLNGLDYWRNNAHAVSLGDFGDKRNPIGRSAWFEPSGCVRAGKLKVKRLGSISVDSSRQTKLDFLAGVKLAKVFPLGKAEVGFDEIVNRKLALECFEVEAADMVRAINQLPALREKLKDLGEDARVCTSTFVVVNYEMSREFASAASIEASIDVQGVTLEPKLSGGGNGKTRLTMDEGMVLAYGIAKPEWDHPNPKKATVLRGLRFDNKA
jgi:hypothetical protein